MRIALLGMGKIGSGVFEQAAETDGIEVVRVLDRRDIPEARGLLTGDFGNIENDDSIDTVVELMGGENPAFEFAVRALEKGKNFVSANKLMISHRLPQLQRAAQKGGGKLLFSAAVGGGIPFLHSMTRASRSDVILSVEGIVNGTTNYMLDAMSSRGVGYAPSLLEAQRLGYAEADPTSDVEGFDASYKIAICAALAFGGYFSPDKVIREGITSIEKEDIDNFRDMGMCVRFIVHAVRDGEKVSAWAGPELCDMSSHYSTIRSNYNYIRYEGKYSGTMGFYGQGAGKDPTAANVIADLLDVKNGGRSMCMKDMREMPASDGMAASFYVRSPEKPPFAAREAGRGAYVTAPVTPLFMNGYAKKLREAGERVAYAMLPLSGK